MFKKKVTLKILALLIFTDVLETFVQFSFKKSALSADGFSVANFSDVTAFLKVAASSPFLWVGLFSVMLIFVIWSTVLSKIDLSVAVPIASFSYIFVPLASILFLHETISFFRWTGIIFILIGVVVVSSSSSEKVEGHSI